VLDRFLGLRSPVVLVLLSLGLALGACKPSDVDEDNFTVEEGDCDDEDDTIYPGALEVCDGVDQDCDTLIDEDFDSDLDGYYDDAECANGTDCDDEAADVNPDEDELCDDVDHDCDGAVDNGLEVQEWCENLDGDPVGSDETITSCETEAPLGYVACSDTPDCDDSDGTSYPGATEICDVVDHDCDGDPWSPLPIYQFWDDEDGDGYGAGAPFDHCDEEAPEGAVAYDATQEDCDDDDGTSNPGEVELCDDVDHDCDGETQNGLTQFDYWPDNDGDGYGAGTVIQDCGTAPPLDHVVWDVSAEEDCDDAAVGVNPGATEACNLIDDNCDTAIDEGFDVDGDLVTTCGPDGIAGNADDDCDDTEATVNPTAPEICDVLDNDCDTLIDEDSDADGDGFTPCGSDGVPGGPDDDCDDNNPDTYPGATELCDGEDNSCDGNIPSDESDGDGDGDPGCADCNDTNPFMFTDNPEVCDGLDNNCDTVLPADEADGDADMYMPCSDYEANGAPGISGGDDCNDADPAINPLAVEICDLVDQDCDTLVDEDFDVDVDGFTTCGADGTPGNADDDCDDTNPDVNPDADEVCDNVDNDCDTDIDDEDTGYLGDDADGDGDEALLCGGLDCDDTDDTVEGLDIDNDGHSTCQGDCDDFNPYVNPDGVESCDGADNDCNGDVDDADAGLVADADGDGFDADGCSLGGTDCDDNDKHVFPDTIYTSGVVPACEPAVYPGFFHEWDYARISLPAYLYDTSTATHYLYYRGHHDQPQQQIGVSSSADGVTWTKEPDTVLGPTSGWDFRNISNPSVAILPSPAYARPYVMVYHGRAETGGLRQIGIATATDPLGPFERLDALTGLSTVTDPVIPPSTDASYLDSGRTLHPAIYWDEAAGELNVWYNARTDPDNTLRVFHAISSDGGATWTRTDGDGDGPDVIYEPTMSAVASSRTDMVSLVEDPFTVGEFEFWYTADEVQVGYTTGTATLWSPGHPNPVLTAAANCQRLDGNSVSARGIRYDMATDTYHWYYGGKTDIEPMTASGTCPGNEDPIYVWLNGGYTASYVAQGTNYAPAVTINTPAAPASAMTFDGTVTDTAPDQLVVVLASSLDGDLGTALITATGNTDQTVQATTWSANVTGLSSGVHDIFVKASDEAGIERSTSISVTVP